MTPAQHAQGHAVIIGAGHAGGTLAALLRQYGHPGPITLVGAEDLPPYQRPPLSKAWLQQAMGPDDLLLRPASAYADQAIALRLGVSAMAIEPGSRQVALNDGSALHYDHLVIATGAAPRWLALPGGERPGVTYLRTMEDAQALRGHLQTARCLAIIGGGYVGLEVASTARKLGVQVRVIEREGRLLSRSASPQMAAHLHGLHAGQGVEVHFNASVTAIQGDSPTGITGLRMADGSRLECDAVLIGVGAAPSVELAQSLGLDCAGGIAVDGEGRTAMAGIYAIGDATRRPLAGYPGLHRLESVPSALEQARRAACAITGRALPAHEAPWFWSDQYDTKLQIAGLPGHGDQTVLRGDPASGRFAVLHLRSGQLCAAECVNSPGEFMAARKRHRRHALRRPRFPAPPPKSPTHAMTTITFIEHCGREHVVQATDGQSLMRAAVSNGVPGIDAECGGACACATCHVYIQPEWLDRVGPAQGGEREMLDFALDVRGDSRLACQITVSPQLNGLVVGMPVAQS